MHFKLVYSEWYPLPPPKFRFIIFIFKSWKHYSYPIKQIFNVKIVLQSSQFYLMNMPICFSKGVKIVYFYHDSAARTIIKQNLGNLECMSIYTLFSFQPLIMSCDVRKKKVHFFIGLLFPFVIVFACRQFYISLSSIKIRNLPQSHPTFESFYFHWTIQHISVMCKNWENF